MQTNKRWMNDIPQQFHSKHNIGVFIDAFSRQLDELEAVFASLETETDLDMAAGINLDGVGHILNLDRKMAAEMLRRSGKKLSDEEYRQCLRYMILKNTNDCTYWDLIAGIKLMWKFEHVKMFEDPDYPASIIFQTDFMDADTETPIEFYGDLCIRPGGVAVLLRKRWKTRFLAEMHGINVPLLEMSAEFLRKNLSKGLDGRYSSMDGDLACKLESGLELPYLLGLDAGVLVNIALCHLDGEFFLDGERMLKANVQEVLL